MNVFQTATAVAIVAAAAPLAAAQDGEAVLARAADAVSTAESVIATVTLRPGAGAFSQLAPSVDATLSGVRTGDGWVIRYEGTVTDPRQKDKGPQPFTVVTAPDRTAWIDHEGKKVIVAAPGIDPRGSVTGQMAPALLSDVFAAEPFRRERTEAKSVTAEGAGEATGESATIVVTEIDKPLRAQQHLAPKTRWYFADSDSLPRRIERITDAGMIALTLIVELSEVRLNTGVDADDLSIETPDGYTRQVEAGAQTARPATPEINARTTPAEERIVEAAPAEPAGPVRAAAPSFKVATLDGDEISSSDLSGRVVVLGFWSTWVPGGEPFAAELAQLSDRLAGQPITILAPLVYEAATGNAQQILSETNAAVTVAIRADESPRGVGLESLAAQFGLDQFPAVAVLDAEGRIAGIAQSINDSTGEAVPTAAVVSEAERLAAAELAKLQEG